MTVSAQVSIQVRDQTDSPLADVTLVLTPLFEFEAQEPIDTAVDQINEAFAPRVNVVQAGAAISFPNQDQVRHHVYSFSATKQFDIPLYSGTPSEPIHFDQPGLVVLGCNIHDQMRGYILVTDSPFFGVSDDNGNLEVRLGQPGNYLLSLWHPEQEEQLETIEIEIGPDLEYNSTVQVNTAKLFLPRRGSSSGGYF